MKKYGVSALSKLSGITIRTLHHYDKIGLLQPTGRTEVGYRYYGEAELLQLQQILFYKELGFSLKEIESVLNNSDFDLVQALKEHKTQLSKKRKRIEVLLKTIDNTIEYITNTKLNMKPEKLYEGLPKEMGISIRDEAIEKFGAEKIKKSEEELLKLNASDYAKLKDKLQGTTEKLFKIRNQDHKSFEVQWLIKQHYEIIRKLWGTYDSLENQAEMYAGLGTLYVEDERYTTMEETPQPEFAEFLSRAMEHFAKHHLK